MTMTKFNLVVNIAVAEDKGEDENLASTEKDIEQTQTFLMGVFDGLGGRSAGYGDKTGGRIASEEASKITKKFFKQWHDQITPENVIQLQDEICRSLKKQADDKMPPRTSSRLKGSLVEHRLCTTIALASIPKQQGQEKIFEANVAWMGDSRIYFLSPTKGLQQLTKDDLVTSKDALEMLRQDPPMSQYLTADINPRWQIHFQHYEIKENGCFLACTDGCFQYFSAPWEFEKLLLETLLQSEGDTKDKNNWQELISQKYNEIKQDDVSLVLYPVGFNGIKHLKGSYQQRWQYLQDNFISPTVNTRYEELQSLWEKYRIDYEYYFQFIPEVQPVTNSKSQISQDYFSTTVIPTTSSSSSSTNKFQDLSKSFQNKAKTKAEEINNLLEQAKSYYKNNQLNEAERLCDEVLKIDDHQVECKYILGQIYKEKALDETDYSQKEILFETALSHLKAIREHRGKDQIATLRTIGFICCQLNKWEDSVSLYQESFKIPGAEKLPYWEEHLETFVTSVRIVNRTEIINVGIGFCQRLANTLLYGENAYAYYYMAVLQEIKGELYPAAWESIKKAMGIYNGSYSSRVKYESVQKARQKYQEILNKINNRR